MRFPRPGELWWFDVMDDGVMAAIFLMVRPAQKDVMRSHGQDCQLWHMQHIMTTDGNDCIDGYNAIWKRGVVSRQLWTEGRWYPIEGTSND